MIIEHLIISVLFAYSLAILLVEKGDDWPVLLVTKPLRYLLGMISKRLSGMLECTVCTSFWAALLGDLFLYFFVKGVFLWPFTGILAVGFTWTIIEILNALDSSKRPPTS